jgi:hypothetical protein
MLVPGFSLNDTLTLGEEDDSKLFEVRLLTSHGERVARYHYRRLAGRELRFPCFADPDHPEDYRLWLHEGWGAVAVRRVSE